jgi:2-dehydropantoate 2-reductase
MPVRADRRNRYPGVILLRILTLGAGAIGGYYSGRLLQAGADVTFLVREKRRSQLEASGLVIESPDGNFTANVKTVTSGDVRPEYDLILLTCKAYDLDAAIAAIAPAMGPRTALLPLLNGVAHMARLNAQFGAERVLGGLAKIVVSLTPEGTIRHMNDWRYITFGEQDGAMSERVLDLKAAFDRTPVVARAVPDIMQHMWEKLVHLSTVAGMACLMRASVGEIARTTEGSRLMIEFLESNARIAAAAGYPPSDSFLADYRKLFADTTSPYVPSMLRDLERKGPIEADHILRFMLEHARKHALDDTLHRIVITHTEAYEQRRAAGRL